MSIYQNKNKIIYFIELLHTSDVTQKNCLIIDVNWLAKIDRHFLN